MLHTATERVAVSKAAADAILALINSKPRTPTEEELVAVLAKASPAPAPDIWRANYLKSDWHHILSAYLDEIYRRGRTEAQRDLQEERFCSKVDAIWAKPCATFADLVVRAAIAVHWNMPPPNLPAYPDDVLNDPKTSRSQRALAQLVKGVLDLAGLKFDADVRCITG
jgi:hypothetical protein